MIVERHVFGSVAGYRTLARSPGLSGQDCRFLETFSFGQPPSQAFVDSLVRNPAYWVRPFGSRRALTRLVPGAPDEAGRSTVLMISAIVAAADWDVALRGDVDPLLRSAPLWQWDGAAQLAPVNLPVTPPSKAVPGQGGAGALLNLVSRIESAGGGPVSIVVREEDLGPEDLRCLGMLIPPSARGQFSWACRSLSCRLGATVNCVAAGVTLDAGAHVVRPHENVVPSVYAQVLDEAGLRRKGVDTAFIATYSRFGRHGERTTGDPSQQPVIVVESPTEESWLAQYGGWALSAVLAVAVIVLTALLLLRSPAEASHQPEGDGNRRAAAITPVEMTVSEKIASAAAELIAAKPLPRDAKRRERVVAALDQLVKAAPQPEGESARLLAGLNGLRNRNSEMTAFESSWAAGTQEISANNIENDYPCEIARLTRCAELRKQLQNSLNRLNLPPSPEPITWGEVTNLEKFNASYAELCDNCKESVEFFGGKIKEQRDRLAKSRDDMEKTVLNLLSVLLEYKCAEDQEQIMRDARAAEAGALDASRLQEICRQTVRLADQQRWCGPDAQVFRTIIDERLARVIKWSAKRLRTISKEEVAKQGRVTRSQLAPIIKELEKAGMSPMEYVPSPDTVGTNGTRQEES